MEGSSVIISPPSSRQGMPGPGARDGKNGMRETNRCLETGKASFSSLNPGDLSSDTIIVKYLPTHFPEDPTFLRLLRYALVDKRTVLQALSLLLLATGATVSGPFLIKVFIDDYLIPGLWDARAMATLVVVYILAQLVGAGAAYRQALLFNTIALGVIQRLREQVFSHVSALPVAYFDKNRTGALTSRITNDTEAIKNLYVNVISFFVRNIVRMIGILMAMALLDIRLMGICVTLIPAAIVLMVIYRRLSTPIFRRVRALLGEINGKLNETIGGMSVIQLTNQQRGFQQEFARASTHHYRAKTKEVMVNAFLLHPLVNLFQMLLLAGLLLRFGWLELATVGAVQVGVLYAFINYLGNLTTPLSEMTARLTMAQQALVSADRLFQLLHEPTAEPAGSVKFPDNNRLVLDIRRFGYDGKKDVLRDIRFTVEAGEFIGIVGHTGSGKSTLLSLLMNFYPVQQGDIRIGGVPISRIGRGIRTSGGVHSGLIGFVQQDPFIFADTVANNIRMELPLGQDEIVQAAQQAQLHGMVLGLPHGYETMLTEQGKNLSAGQRQLLSLARTLARKPKILILDEATANIDSHTEALIRQSLMALRGKVTLIAIAHRLGTVKEADRLYVLHQGHVQQSGTHEELMAREGLYKHMYELQHREELTFGENQYSNPT
uniref:ATP-binding cassette, subfamily B, multidrug efflux pump n=1 Tax=Candidatus Kentrum eta TaxID=2126337 RepID=A0A450UYW3_9GAMM|nr:MAG: ATP-binding cassette, subfamily B, multidrug efflux pump [Candidatus Kentron sp. H]VFJ98574.1 MAG: ATP-binding cassette, subfamily B, multidrug efflux pump [Candidatus Kentron sp. H]VFK03308.1 MAG: ATP-binding cassette, subfamily B, multidrug efflux pump [Candidatus Kentron sp. H]